MSADSTRRAAPKGAAPQRGVATEGSLGGVSSSTRRAAPKGAAPHGGWRPQDAWGVVTNGLSLAGVFRLASRLLVRDIRADELRLMALSLIIAVASFTSVAFFADRVKLALSQQASTLLGADLVVVSDRPLDPAFHTEAQRLGLTVTATTRFPSMIVAGEHSLLTEIKAVTPGYPLKGRLRAKTLAADAKSATALPATGEAWVDERVLTRLGLALGDRIAVGERSLRVAGQVTDDVDSNLSFFNVMPKLLMNDADLASTALVVNGSRVTYRLMVAGDRDVVSGFRTFATGRVKAGQRVEDIRDARPEIRAALEKAERFLGLASLLSVVLAAVAVALSARRYIARHLDNCAMLRCFGASRALTLWLHVIQLAALGLVAGVVGCLVGFIAQWGLAELLAPIVQVTLPAPSLVPAVQGVIAGFVLLLGFALPPLLALGRVPTLRVLRRDLGTPAGLDWIAYAAGLAAVVALIVWHTRDLKLSAIVLGGVVGGVAVSGVIALLLVRVVTIVGARAGFAWRFGLANLARRALGSVIQVIALGAGLLALMLLSLTRGDLLESWKTTVPPGAPNRFLVNIQPDQRELVNEFFRAEGKPAPVLYPMVRARLTTINGVTVNSANFTAERARRLVDREFNLSWSAKLQADNEIVGGHWWKANAAPVSQFSMEAGIAEALGLKLGDRLTYDVAGTELAGAITSLRKVNWDNFRVNFFVVAPPGTLDAYPASWVTSFYLPAGQDAMMDRLVQRFPNLLVVDVAAILAQVQTMMAQVVKAVEFVFLFSVGAGMLVLFAGIQSTQDERIREAAILRTLGGSTRQIVAAQAAEFVVVGALAGVLAAIGATAIGYVLARQVLNLPYSINPWIWVVGLVAGGVGVLIAGLLGTRSVLRVSPLETLRRD